MDDVSPVGYRFAAPDDAEPIARLHAESWRRHYRDAYSDSFLDGDVLDDRRSVWTDRLSRARADACTIVAEATRRMVGFAHTILDDDPRWGALLDNLHVTAERARRGIGTRLLALTAAVVVERRPGSALHLWVLEQNLAAQAFYTARAGRCVERATVMPPGGDAGRLNGSPVKLRFVWPDPTVLVRASRLR